MGSIKWIVWVALAVGPLFINLVKSRTEIFNVKENCGRLFEGADGTVRFPWTATLHRVDDSDVDKPVSVLTPSLLVMNANHFFKKEGKLLFYNFTAYSVSSNLTRLGQSHQNNPFTQTVEITHIRPIPNLIVSRFWPFYENDFALIHLKRPLKFDSQVHGLCIPTFDIVQEILALDSNVNTSDQTSVLISGWKRYKPDYIYHNLTVNPENECYYWWSSHNETMDASYTNRYCANISANPAHTECINKDNSIVGQLNPGGQYYFLGLVNNFYSDNRICNSKTRIFINTPIAFTLDAIRQNMRCGPQNFTCDNGECVTLESICNGTDDCQDKSDENYQYCDAVLHRFCNDGQYQCKMSRKCIEKSKRCNSVRNCEGGDDEEDCGDNSIALEVVIGVLCTMLFIVGIIYLLKKLDFAWSETRDLNDKEIRIFREGLKNNSPKSQNMDSQVINIAGGSENVCNSAIALPYDSVNFEIARENLKIEQRILGKGKFAIVYKAVYDCGDSCQDVAVKTFKTCGYKSAFMSQLSELKIMSRIGPHENTVNLIGAYTKEIKKRILHIVVELCQLGNLQTYLSENRERFIDVIDRDGNLHPDANQRLKKSTVTTQYENVIAINKAGLEKPFTTLDLLLWSFQIASAMEYIASKNVSHGDLAARNILLTENYTAKLSDFGLSCELHKTGTFRKKYYKKTPLPWKWMAIETLKKLEFSTASDVWSYGVTIWEIFTLGQIPYPGLEFESIYDELVSKGTRLQEPDFASKEIYEKMKHCWNANPGLRLNFTDLKTYFQGLHQCLDYVMENDEL